MNRPGPLVATLRSLLAAAGLLASAGLEGGAARAVLAFSATMVLAAFGLTSWRLRREGAATGTIDWGPLLDRLDRIAVALETRPAPAEPTARPVDLSAVRIAIAERKWEAAEGLLAEHRDHPEAARLGADLAAAKALAADGLLAELKAAQEANDPERVLAIHAGLATVLPVGATAEHEARVVKWLMALIMRRLRGGTVRVDVAELAARVAESFPSCVEGASLRASLPTLRRSAGLCPRCARPYRGIADACPVCLTAPAPEVAPVPDAVGDLDPVAEGIDPA